VGWPQHGRLDTGGTAGLENHIALLRIEQRRGGRQDADEGEKDAVFRAAVHTLQAGNMFAQL
ncbi:MAG: hypothetical protein ABUL65_05010, partial [Opitutus sp.]